MQSISRKQHYKRNEPEIETEQALLGYMLWLGVSTKNSLLQQESNEASTRLFTSQPSSTAYHYSDIQMEKIYPNAHKPCHYSQPHSYRCQCLRPANRLCHLIRYLTLHYLTHDTYHPFYLLINIFIYPVCNSSCHSLAEMRLILSIWVELGKEYSNNLHPITRIEYRSTWLIYNIAPMMPCHSSALSP